MTTRLLSLGPLVALLAALPAAAGVRISEFVASNQSGRLDREGNTEDWIELYNDSPVEVNLAGWSLTDDASALRKWVIPDLDLPADGYLLIVASGKNRRVPGEELHTNFSLRSSGEYLALVRPDGVTVEDEYAPNFPGQFDDVSYGLGQTGQVTTTIVAQGAAGHAGVPASAADFDANFVDWNSRIAGTFNGSTWRAVNSGVGLDQAGAYGAWLGTGGDFEANLLNENGSIFLRLPFEVADPSLVTRLTLRMRWDDGFVASINGTEVASNRAPANRAWNSQATSSRGEGENDDWISYPIDLSGITLEAGQNLLALQGMNDAIDSPDLLILPELELTTGGVSSGGHVFHATPTPGESNGGGSVNLPPLLTAVTSVVEEPIGGAASEPLIITAKVEQTAAPISWVRIYYKVTFGAEETLNMRDDGGAPDEVAEDGIYTAAVPTAALRRGNMLRWRVEARDTAARVSSDPPYPDPLDSDRYYGTIAADSSLRSSLLPVLHTFVQNEGAVNTRSGSRVSVYYLGRFYDNVQMDVHGQSTSGGAFPKKSYDMDFNKGNRFRWKEGEGKVKDINLLTNYADKSKVRNTLGYEFLRRCGTPNHFAFPVRVQRNSAFYSVQDMVEDGDDRWLDRIGLDGNGALYKMYDRMEDANRASKKTRKHEGNSDLRALISRLAPNISQDQRRRFAYDSLNIPGCVNYLASYTVAGITDAGHKNYYMYRDTEGTGEWCPLPWDVDLSAGRRWTGSENYFHDQLHHDFWNASSINRLWDLIHNTPDYREMYLRRVATLREDILKRPGTPLADDWFTQRVHELEDLVDPEGARSDADLDYRKWLAWGSPSYQQMRQCTDRLLTQWLTPRRVWMFDRARSQGGVRVPAVQPAVPNVTIETIDVNPVSGNQEEEYFEIKNHERVPIDLSGWKVSGAVEFEIPAGTVIPVGTGDAAARYVGLLHVAKQSRAFRGRRVGPRAGQFRLVVDGYKGQLSARGETVVLSNAAGALVDSLSYPRDSSPAQDHLRISEFNYHPQNPTPTEEEALPGVIAEDFEWIEMVNTGDAPLDLENVRFLNGINFTFGAISLPAGERWILARNPVAFALRNPAVTVPVLGPYSGYLDNDGEKLQLVDAQGENIMNFDFNDRWYPSTDGEGNTLVLRDLSTAWQLFEQSESWGSSVETDGSAGAAGSGYHVHFNGWQVTHFNAAERADLTVGDALANPDGDPYPNWQEYAFGLDPRSPDEAGFESRLVVDSGQDYLGATVHLRALAADLSWQLESVTTGDEWQEIPQATIVSDTPAGDFQNLLIREPDPVGSTASKLVRLRVDFAP